MRSPGLKPRSDCKAAALTGVGEVTHAMLRYADGMVMVESQRPDDLHGSHTGKG